MIILLYCLGSVVFGVNADLKADIIAGKTPIRGVNFGGWLVAEHWMTKGSPAWNGVPEDIANKGEFAAMKHLGHEKGDKQFEDHRKNHITEKDFKDATAAKLNTIRIPVGYWIVGFDNSGGGDPNGWKVYAPGALKYLDKAIREWAPKYKLLVSISFHAAKGSQNGMDHSAPQNFGTPYWSQYQENVNNTLEAVTWLVKRYDKDAAFLGIGLLNEPRWDQDERVLKQYYYDAYGRIRNDLKSNCLLMTSPLLSQQGLHDSDWGKFMPPPKYQNIRHEWHRYQVWGFEADKQWTAEKIITFVRDDLSNQIKSWPGNWLFLGEWSLATADSVPMTTEQLHRYAKVQLDAFNAAPGGWTFWAWKFYNDDKSRNVWSLKSMIEQGFIKL